MMAIGNVSAETMSDESSCSSAAEKVGSIDDILTEILLRLPVRSVLRFESVSKRFHFLTSNPSFRLLHSRRNRNPPSGLLVPVRKNGKPPLLECELVQFDVSNPVKSRIIKPNILPPDVTLMKIKHSCNGLMLCRASLKHNYFSSFYIYNPTIKQLTSLPSFESYNEASYRQRGMTLVFDPSKSPHYIIVYAYVDEGDYQIEIYESHTRIFRHSCTVPVSIGGNLKVRFEGGVYWNNAIFWLHGLGYVLYFNLDQETVDKLETHFPVSYIFESRDQLLLVEIVKSESDLKLKIHEVKSDYGLCLKYLVDLDEIVGAFTEITRPLSQYYDFGACDVLSVVLGEKKDDSFVVLLVDSKVVRLNLVSNTFHKLCDSKQSRGTYEWPYGYGFQFVESLLTFDASNSRYSAQG